MRKVDRSLVSAPKVLAAEGRKGHRELERARAFYADPARTEETYDFKAYSDDAVKYALEKLFHGKCAYCESFYASQAPVDVEHFRPKGQVSGEPGHRGYWWLAMNWTNLLPSCIDCNRRRWQAVPAIPDSLVALLDSPTLSDGKASLGKADLFPLAGLRATSEASPLADEQPLLINPCDDDPAQDLAFYIDRDHPVSLLVPAMVDERPSARGVASIHVYGLNRLGLVQERTRVLRKLEFLGHMMDELHDVADSLRDSGPAMTRTAARIDYLIDKILSEIQMMGADDQPYSQLVRAWLRVAATT